MQSLLQKISIVVPSFQQGKFIERTLQSIIAQEYPNVEIILMDGGSSDDTLAIVEKYKAFLAHIVSAPDEGQSDAIVKGFALASGEIISWLNSDDTYKPGTLKYVGDYFLKHPSVDFVYGNRDIIDENDQVIGRRRQPDFNLGVMMYAHIIVPQMSAFWKKHLYDQSGGIDKHLVFSMDYDLFIKMAKISSPVHLPLTLANFRIHGASKTTNLEAVRLAEDNLVRERHCKIKPSHGLIFKLTEYYYLLRLVILFALNGGLWERIKERYLGRKDILQSTNYA